MSEFDIREHHFSDHNLSHDGDTLNLETEEWSYYYDANVSTDIQINREDVIALAKHFRLTQEDLV